MTVISRYVIADPSALQAHVDKIVGVRTAELAGVPLTGGPVSPPLTRRGTTNRNARGGADDRRRRREWLVRCFRADKDVVVIDLFHGPMTVEVAPGTEGSQPACRCYRCGVLLTVDTVTVDRIKPGCQGGTYRRDNIRPACGRCGAGQRTQEGDEMNTGNWPPSVDALPVGVDDPPNYHHRKLTAEGHPLMGSSPAEREEARQRGERARAASMRDHPFVGEGPYCEARISFAPMGPAETITGWSGCGWSREMHP